MTLTNTQKIELENQAYYIYNEFQATMAGQTMSDLDALESHFNNVADELGENKEDLWDKCETMFEQNINV